MRLHARPQHSAALLAAVTLATIAACASPTASQASDAATAAASPSRSTYGTQTPLLSSPNFEEAGLTATTLSFEAEPDTVVTDNLGVTYIEPRPDGSADLTVKRALWDGTEEWSATVPVPEDAQGMNPRLSQDPGIGVVAVWFRGASEINADGALIIDNTHAMSSQVTWLDVETGTATTQDLMDAATQFSGTDVRTNEKLVGAIVMEGDSVTTGVLYLGAGNTLAAAGWGDFVSSSASLSLSDVAQWQGMPLFTVTDKQSGVSRVQLGAKELLTTDDQYTGYLPGPTHLALRESGNLWLVDAEGNASQIDTGDCEFGNNDQYPTLSDTALYAGLARIALEDQSVDCLDDLSPTQDAKIAGEFSDGSLLLTSSLSNADLRGTWLVPADRSSAVDLGSLGPIEVHSDHIVNVNDGSEVATVDVYDYRDLLPQE